ncbi:MAG: 30S ribosomal protein S11 [Candidatus Hodgkinia cicadicola]
MLVLRKSSLLKRLKKRAIELGSATIKASACANDVIVCCVDCSGNVVVWTSAGERGFKGAKKASPFAAQITMETILKKVARLGGQPPADAEASVRFDEKLVCIHSSSWGR